MSQQSGQDEPLHAAVEDDQQTTEIDSTFSDESASTSSSTSLASSILNHVYENGRRYNAYQPGSYLNPNDEDEQDRLDLQHHIWKSVQGGRLYIAPIEQPLEILDVGTGTGIWAIEMADEFPAALVTGTDISPIQPQWVPPNCTFYIDDVESPWTFQKQFDFIHGRALGGAIGDWKAYYAEAYRNLKPGGWFEMQEFEAFFFCDDGTLKDDSWCVRWLSEMDRGSKQFGKHFNVAPIQKELMIEAGFTNIQTQIFKIPVGIWPRDKKLKELGQCAEVMALKSVEAAAPAMYTRVLGYSIEETRIVIEQVKREISDRKIHKYVKYHFICGQKSSN